VLLFVDVVMFAKKFVAALVKHKVLWAIWGICAVKLRVRQLWGQETLNK